MSSNECMPKATFTVFQKNGDKFCPNQLNTYNFEQDNIQSYLNFNFDSKESFEFILEIISSIGIFIFILLNSKFNQRKSLIPRILAIAWIIFGFKYYLDRVSYTFTFEDSILLSCSIISIVIGFLLYINFYDLLFARSNLQKRSFLGNLKFFLESLLFNYSFAIFDIDKINLMMNVSNEIHQTNTFLSYFYSVLYYLFIGMNYLPLICNYLVKKRIYNLPLVLFPTPMSLCSFTLFLSFFKNNMSNSFFLLLNSLLYSLLILNFIYEVYVLKIVSFEHYFFIAITILNLILNYSLNNFSNLFGLTSLIKRNIFNNDYSLVINSHQKGDGGIQGFLGRVFKCDSFGLIADVFLIINSKNCLVSDDRVKDVTLDAKHIYLVYPVRNSLI